MSKNDLEFLVAALGHHGVEKSQVQDLIDSFEDLSKSEKEVNKMIKTDKVVLVNALVNKYIEVKSKLDEMVGGKSDLFVKKFSAMTSKQIRFREQLKLHPLGMEKILEIFPIFTKGE